MLEVIVFICGAVLMVLELVGSRVVAPYLGTSIVVWTSLIGVILASLSFGYYYGGKIADKHATFDRLATIILAACGGIIWIIFINNQLIPTLLNLVPTVYLKSLFITTLLFTPSSVLLGMVSPYAVKLKLSTLSKSGITVGRLYAISTCGSILGTFLGGFVLISYLGTEKILILLAVILFLTTLLTKHANFIKLFTVLIIGLTIILMSHSLQAKYIADVDTDYSRIQVVQTVDPKTKQPEIIMKTNGEADSEIFNYSDELVYPVARYFRLGAHFSPKLDNLLVIGGAGYSYPKDFLKNYSNGQIDVVEIDPGITDMAKKYFRLHDDPRLQIYHEDGRIFLNSNQKLYDVIIGDAFKSFSPPYNLTTKEAIGHMYNSLTPGGVVIMNIVSSIEGNRGEFLRSEYITYKSVFPQVYVFTVNDHQDGKILQNLILIALKTNQTPSFSDPNLEMNSNLQNLWKKPITADLPVLTDDYAPVEQYLAKALY